MGEVTGEKGDAVRQGIEMDIKCCVAAATVQRTHFLMHCYNVSTK